MRRLLPRTRALLLLPKQQQQQTMARSAALHTSAPAAAPPPGRVPDTPPRLWLLETTPRSVWGGPAPGAEATRLGFHPAVAGTLPVVEPGTAHPGAVGWAPEPRRELLERVPIVKVGCEVWFFLLSGRSALFA
jgi:hypothetical protein